MQTKQIYYQYPYKKDLDAKVVSINQTPSMVNIVLDQSIFYPEGGGQPCDTGTIKGKSGSVKVEYVRFIDGEIVHQGKLTGNIKNGDPVSLSIDWNSRHKYMRIHSAGHLLHDTLMAMFPDLIPSKGSHGKKAFLEYQGIIDPNKKELIERKTNEYLQKDLSVITKEASYDEIKKECQFVPENLPKNKPLRMLKIGDFPGMPDGGVQVKSTKEIGKIWIANITNENEKSVIRYGIAEN